MIPKIIHLIWYQSFPVIPAYLNRVPGLWQKWNPEYTIMRWDSGSMEGFIRNKYPQFYASWLGLSTVIKRCDMARFLILHHYGGVYADCDLFPSSPLDTFLESRKRYCQKVVSVTNLPLPYPEEPYDFRDVKLILSREYRPIDRAGYGIANGIMIARPRCATLLEFANSRHWDTGAKVLDYMGPHAFTRFIRQRAAGLKGVVSVVSPYYFLWEKAAMQCDIPSWSVSSHLARNHWGDHSRPDWWEVA